MVQTNKIRNNLIMLIIIGLTVLGLCGGGAPPKTPPSPPSGWPPGWKF